MATLASALFEVASFSAVIVLIVLGLGVVASMMGVFNFAHGEFVLIGATTTYLVHAGGLPVWLGMLLAPLVAGLAGLAVERWVVRRFYGATVVAMLATYAVGLVIRESVRGLLGGQYYTVPEPFSGTLLFGTVRVSAWKLALIGIALATVAASVLALSRTQLGLRIRAALENPALARACGVSTGAVYAFTFAFGAALAGLAGALLVPGFSLFADLGVSFLIQGFVSVMVGGLGGFAGPLAGAALIGTAGAALPWFMSSVVAEILVFVLALVLVRARPQGLFSAKGV